MQIEFVNHAALIITAGDVRLISDPWLEGKVFHDGWALTASSVMRFDDFKDITHIWFSHEHPDHFNPINLKKIPEACRRTIHVLYQETQDKKVVNFCRKLGFGQVTELPPRTWIQLGDQMKVLNCPSNTNWMADSWLCVRTPGGTLLNMNDCGAQAELPAIKEMVGTVDVLATQFSYAQWEKNHDAVDYRRAHEQRVLEVVRQQIEILAPRYVIPFASFAWFCTDDNFYLNSEKNKLRDVVSFIRAKTRSEPIAMYPGDRWTVGEPHDSSAAISRFEQDSTRIADPAVTPRTRHAVVDVQALVAAGARYRDRLLALAPAPLVRLYLALQSYQDSGAFRGKRLGSLVRLATLRAEPARLFVTDLNQAFTFDLSGLEPSSMAREACDIMLTSASLAYCFQFDWGGETLYVNGCFQENEGWRNVGSLAYPNRFFKYCNLLRRADLGYKLSWARAARAVFRKLSPV